MLLAAPHAPELVFLRSCRLGSDDVVVVATGIVEVYVHDLAAHAVALIAVRTVPGTLFHLSAECAGSGLVHSVHEL